MATVYPTATGNYSTRTWNNDATGAAYGMAPQAGDTILLNNTTLTIDQDVTVTLIRNIAGTTAAAGGGLSVSGTRSITANLTAGAALLLTLPTVNLTVNGNITGGNGGTNAYGLSCGAAGATLTVNGNLIGGSASGASALSWSGGTGTITITGNVTGGSAANANGFFHQATTGSATITGTITAGSNASAHGINKSGASTLTVNGNVVSATGNGIAISGGTLTIAGDLSYTGTIPSLNISGATTIVTVTPTSPIVGAFSAGIITMSAGSTRIVSNVSAGGTGNANAIAVGGGTLTIEGNVSAGAGTTAYAIVNNTTAADIRVIGNVTGGTSAAILCTATNGGTCKIIGDVSGGGGAGGYGINYTSATIATATVMIYGTVTGGSSATAYGLYNQGAAKCWVFGSTVAGTAAATNNTGSGSITTVAVGGGGGVFPVIGPGVLVA